MTAKRIKILYPTGGQVVSFKTPKEADRWMREFGDTPHTIVESFDSDEPVYVSMKVREFEGFHSDRSERDWSHGEVQKVADLLGTPRRFSPFFECDVEFKPEGRGRIVLHCKQTWPTQELVEKILSDSIRSAVAERFGDDADWNWFEYPSDEERKPNKMDEFVQKNLNHYKNSW